VPSFDEVYREWFDFVWRNLGRMGIPPAGLDDAAQDVFLVVFRRLADFEGRSTLKSWLFGIVVRVASQHRRTRRRRPEESLPADLVSPDSRDPHSATVRSRALQLVRELLDELDDDKRTVFILAELEQMTAPEIADALSINTNTVYSRLRAARRAFDAALAARGTEDGRLE
jgi:RNA polymerase sigma-70 factor (ECF subfamily)